QAALPTVSRAPNAAVAKYIALLRFIAFLPFEGKLSTTLPVLQHAFWGDGRLCGFAAPSHQAPARSARSPRPAARGDLGGRGFIAVRLGLCLTLAFLALIAFGLLL